MHKDTVVGLPGTTASDALTDVLRSGARRLLVQAIELEVEEFLAHHSELVLENGIRRVVRNGHLPERAVQTGIGAVPVRVPRVRDRGSGVGEAVQFHSRIVPPYLRRTKSIEELIPWLYLKGVSSGDFSEALCALVGPGAPGLSPSTVSRLKEVWQEEWKRWQARDLSKKRYVYFWVDGVYFSARLEEERQCILIVIGADKDGKKELVGILDGYRESEQSWTELLLQLRDKQGLRFGPKLAVGDGALGFWKALAKVYPGAREQRCWVHKTANVLNKLPKGTQSRAKQHIHEIWMAESKREASVAFDYFLSAYEAKHPKATECLAKDREALLAFYDFPAEHWKHIRTTNPVESTFATVRLRTRKTRGCLSRETVLTMVFKLALSAEKKWHRLTGSARLAEVIADVRFVDGICQEDRTEEDAA